MWVAGTLAISVLCAFGAVRLAIAAGAPIPPARVAMASTGVGLFWALVVIFLLGLQNL
jgi:hypothetical protein